MTRPTFSLVTSWYNVVRMQFDWTGALENWLSFLGTGDQLVIAINTSDDDTPAKVREWVARWQTEHANGATIDILDIAIPYTNPAFDGKGKAAATAAATQPYVILLDCDERICPHMRRKWDVLALELERSPYEAFLVPSVDLCGDEQHYSAANAKWYLHRNLSHLTRGVVKWARREDGSIDKTRSDTCELINRETGELARSAAIIAPGLPHYITVPQLESGEVPFVYHLGALDLEQRVRQSAFWRPVWDLRDQQSQEPETTLATLEAIPRYRHNLPSWRDTR